MAQLWNVESSEGAFWKFRHQRLWVLEGHRNSGERPDTIDTAVSHGGVRARFAPAPIARLTVLGVEPVCPRVESVRLEWRLCKDVQYGARKEEEG